MKIEGGQEENFNMFYIQNKTKVLAQAISIQPRTALGKDKDQCLLDYEEEGVLFQGFLLNSHPLIV